MKLAKYRKVKVYSGDVFEDHLKEAGNFIGVGRFRPRMNGFYGRFKVDKIDWSE